MVRRIVTVLFFMAAVVGARHAVPLQGLAFAQQQGQLQENAQPCPPECTVDTMEIMTWYPSPWNSYEELYTMKLGVGDVTTGDGEKNLRPKTVGSIKVERSVVFKPMAEDPVPEKDLYTGEYTNVEQGEMIYNSGEDKFKYFNGQTWVPQGGGGGGGSYIGWGTTTCASGWSVAYTGYASAMVIKSGNMGPSDTVCSARTFPAAPWGYDLSMDFYQGRNSISTANYVNDRERFECVVCVK